MNRAFVQDDGSFLMVTEMVRCGLYNGEMGQATMGPDGSGVVAMADSCIRPGGLAHYDGELFTTNFAPVGCDQSPGLEVWSCVGSEPHYDNDGFSHFSRLTTDLQGRVFVLGTALFDCDATSPQPRFLFRLTSSGQEDPMFFRSLLAAGSPMVHVTDRGVLVIEEGLRVQRFDEASNEDLSFGDEGLSEELWSGGQPIQVAVRRSDNPAIDGTQLYILARTSDTEDQYVLGSLWR
ncbi:MAG: hypothetical protein AAGA48_14525 [Myxococcota bacterium]